MGKKVRPFIGAPVHLWLKIFLVYLKLGWKIRFSVLALFISTFRSSSMKIFFFYNGRQYPLLVGNIKNFEILKNPVKIDCWKYPEILKICLVSENSYWWSMMVDLKMNIKLSNLLLKVWKRNWKWQTVLVNKDCNHY